MGRSISNSLGVPASAIEQTANYWYENAPKIIWLIAFTGTLVLPFVYFAEKRII